MSAHDEHHAHAHAPRARHGVGRRRLAVVMALTFAYMLAEVAGGLASGSLALLADAGHMLSDSAALALALFAGWVAMRPADSRRTYGFHRAEILGALLNGATLLALCAYLTVQAMLRLFHPTPVRGDLLAGVALGGLALNLGALFLLAPARTESLNLRAAWLHVLVDALGSVGAIVAGVLTWRFGLVRADAVATLLIAALVVHSAWNLLEEAVSVLMEGAPPHLDVDAVLAAMRAVDGVREVHDLHAWSITSRLVALSGHVIVAQGQSRDHLLRTLTALLADRFHVGHVTLQLEPEGCEVEH
jgi:cobalt-zinc-cadmium efflux system protein